jgi:hypothetical protein
VVDGGAEDGENGDQHVKQTVVDERGQSQPVAADDARVVPPRLPRVAPEPVRTRRRPLLIGLGVALTALGGLGAAWLASADGGTVAVLGVAREIRGGQIVHRQDLATVHIATGSGLSSLPVRRAGDVVGKRSLVRMLPGSLLNPAAVADKLVPAAGQALVGLSLGPGQRPTVPLDTGDSVEIVNTPGSEDASTSGSAPPLAVLALVVNTEEDLDANKMVVNVSVPVDAAAKVATWGSAGHATIAVLSPSQH